MDRGGVEPQKQTGKSAPDTDRTRPSCPQNNISNLYLKYKEPTQVSPLESRTVSFTALLPAKPNISYLLSMSSIVVEKLKTPILIRISSVESAEFPLSRHKDVSRPSHDIAHEQACLIKPRVYIKPHEPFTQGFKAGQDSSAISLVYIMTETSMINNN
ncbi:MAG: hypothetical protein A3H64_01850 [Candidatus Ryanbacteria bacterium RIFCSPLOWO2_02_FULL_45_11c]|uniref:Uncharacterized protein n=1 Tax=Candidatus Ryanbacteria bacterium RIFCSPLOWO2_02_FULL_45_11c TaxID=1802128 RepID=A0A1G2H3U1_9BACT|nr:MAG: hypothetical protein A3H64_01850 [Candidatus Ryanbacteria bacterium RIFCSPLOWO2_02_FULL_45_11c]